MLVIQILGSLVEQFVVALESEASAVVALPGDFPTHCLEGHIGFHQDMELVDYDLGVRQCFLDSATVARPHIDERSAVQVSENSSEALELDFIDTQPHRCFTLMLIGQYRHVLRVGRES